MQTPKRGKTRYGKDCYIYKCEVCGAETPRFNRCDSLPKKCYKCKQQAVKEYHFKKRYEEDMAIRNKAFKDARIAILRETNIDENIINPVFEKLLKSDNKSEYDKGFSDGYNEGWNDSSDCIFN